MGDEWAFTYSQSDYDIYKLFTDAIINLPPATNYAGYSLGSHTAHRANNKALIDRFLSIQPEMVGSKVDKHPIHTGVGYEHKNSTEVPDHVTCLTGYRVWEVRDNGLESYEVRKFLSSMSFAEQLKPAVATKASCAISNNNQKCWMRGIHDGFVVPVEQCECGYYSFKSIEALATGYLHEDYRDFIVGIADIWGRVIEHENGYRSEYIYPRELWISKPEHEYLGEMYGVPIRKAY